MYTWNCEWVRPIFSVTSQARHIAFPSWEFAHDQRDNNRWIFQQLGKNSICFEKSPQFLRILLWLFSSISSQRQIAGFEYLDFHSYKACINIWHFLGDPVACIVRWEIATMENTTFSILLDIAPQLSITHALFLARFLFLARCLFRVMFESCVDIRNWEFYRKGKKDWVANISSQWWSERLCSQNLCVPIRVKRYFSSFVWRARELSIDLIKIHAVDAYQFTIS